MILFFILAFEKSIVDKQKMTLVFTSQGGRQQKGRDE
jgi:hypothetical protein